MDRQTAKQFQPQLEGHTEYFFDRYGALPFLLKYNYNTENLDTNVPLFYGELLCYFRELTKYSEENNNDLILRNNRKVTMEKTMFFGNDGVITAFFLLVIYQIPMENFRRFSK